MSSYIKFGTGQIEWLSGWFYDRFMEQAIGALVEEVPEAVNQFEASKDLGALHLSDNPDAIDIKALHVVKRTAEVILDGKLPAWVKTPEDDCGQTVTVATLLYYTKQDLGLVPLFPPRRGNAYITKYIGRNPQTRAEVWRSYNVAETPDAKLLGRTLPYWVYEPFLERAIAVSREDQEMERLLEQGIANGELEVLGDTHASEYRRLRLLKAAAESVIESRTSGWLQKRPRDEEGRHLYVMYISELLECLKKEIQAREEWAKVVIEDWEE